MYEEKIDNPVDWFLIIKARSDYAVSAGLRGYGYQGRSFLLNTHVAQFICVELGEEQLHAGQNNEQYYDNRC
jgi:hypothetical protein